MRLRLHAYEYRGYDDHDDGSPARYAVLDWVNADTAEREQIAFVDMCDALRLANEVRRVVERLEAMARRRGFGSPPKTSGQSRPADRRNTVKAKKAAKKSTKSATKTKTFPKAAPKTAKKGKR